MSDFDAVVIGAGVVGLAVARELALRGHSVLVLEREARLGTGVSARNSEVIHAGLHYPHGSWKERLCIDGKRRLYAFCEARGVPHRRIGKLTFAREESGAARLQAIFDHAREAKADPELALLDGTEAAGLEPALSCTAALLSPSSGIVDTQALMMALLAEAEDHGAMLVTHAPVEWVERTAGGWRVHSGESRLAYRIVVNAAGLGAQTIARTIDALDPDSVPPLHLARGRYWTYAGKVPFSRLIYPLPTGAWLGTHLTLDLGGAARFGPDFEWIDSEDYTCDPASRDSFLAAAQAIWPDLDPERLVPGWAGIRPRITGPGEPDADFLIQGPRNHGLEGLVNLFGIESPGLTASLALADAVAELVD